MVPYLGLPQDLPSPSTYMWSISCAWGNILVANPLVYPTCAGLDPGGEGGGGGGRGVALIGA